jgi:hypothetical protein
MRIPSLGNRSLPASLTAGVFGGDQAQIFHQLAGMLEAGQVAAFGHEGHRDGELDAPQRLQRLDHRLQEPGFHMVLEFLLQPLEAFGLFIDCPDVFWEDDLLRGGGTDHFGEPPEMGWAPGGPARIPDILPQQESLEPELGGLEVPQGIFAGTGKIADGFVLDCGDIDRCKIARAHQAGQLHGVTAVGLHPVARLFGNQGRGDDPADVAFLGEIPVEPVPTGSRFIDKDEMLGLRVELPDEVIDVTLTGADGAQIDDLAW